MTISKGYQGKGKQANKGKKEEKSPFFNVKNGVYQFITGDLFLIENLKETGKAAKFDIEIHSSLTPAFELSPEMFVEVSSYVGEL